MYNQAGVTLCYNSAISLKGKSKEEGGEAGYGRAKEGNDLTFNHEQSFNLSYTLTG